MPATPLQRTAIAVVAIAVLHLLVIAAIAELLWATSGNRPALLRPPPQPLLLAAVALLMAHCSLGGIWWARTRWPSHVKTLLAVLVCAAAWGMLLVVLPEGRSQADHAAGWAASFGTQFVLTSLLAAAIEIAIRFRRDSNQHRFTILTLLIWMAVVGCVLGGGRSIAGLFGWTANNFFAWQYFQQLQAMAFLNAALAIATLACVRFTSTWRTRCAACIIALVVAVPLLVTAMWGMFGNRAGVSFNELAWLMTTEGLFLAVTLLPLEMAREWFHISK
jgi:hypothetical protein